MPNDAIRMGYYHTPHVVERMLEYCGAGARPEQKLDLGRGSLERNRSLHEAAGRATCKFLSGNPMPQHQHNYVSFKPRSVMPADIGRILDQPGADPFRSIWDLQSLIFALDIELVNHSSPESIYTDYKRTFVKLEPVYQCTRDILQGFGIWPLIIMTGQGYHFVWRVQSYSSGGFPDGEVTSVTRGLEAIGHLEETFSQYDQDFAEHCKYADRPVTGPLQKAFDGQSKLMEYIVHEVLRNVGSYKRECGRFFNEDMNIPIGIGDLHTTLNPDCGVNLDLSAFASMVHLRVTRLAASLYYKHVHKKYGDTPFVIVPRLTPCNSYELSINEALKNRAPEHAKNYLLAVDTLIPECSEGTGRLLSAFNASALARYYQEFDSEGLDNQSCWGRTYLVTDTNWFSDRTKHAIQRRNNERNCSDLLTPSVILDIVKKRSSADMGPRQAAHIGGYLRALYTGTDSSVNWGKVNPERYSRKWVGFYSALAAFGLLDSRFC